VSDNDSNIIHVVWYFVMLYQWAVPRLTYKPKVSQCITTSVAGNVYSNSMPCTRSGLTPSDDARSSSVVSETSSIPANQCHHLTTSNPEINLLHHIVKKSFMKLEISSVECGICPTAKSTKS